VNQRKDYYGRRSIGPQPVRSGRNTGAIIASVLRFAQVVCFGLGLVLVGWYLAEHTLSHLGRNAAIDSFRNTQKASIQARPMGGPSPELTVSKPVDTSLWSEERVEAYRQTLFAGSSAPIAVLKIPSVEIEVPVFVGTDEWALTRGAGWIQGTAAPGATGNAGIASHRDGFFRPLKDVGLGDTVILETRQGSITYSIESIRIVDPTDVSVLEPTGDPSVTLVTCYPFYFVGSAPQRYIVKAASVPNLEGR